MQSQEKVSPRPGKVEHPNIWIWPLRLANDCTDSPPFEKDRTLQPEQDSVFFMLLSAIKHKPPAI